MRQVGGSRAFDTGEYSANLTRRGKRRPEGRPDPMTALVTDASLQAAEEAPADGLVGSLREQAHERPGPLLALLGKVLPMRLDGDAENPIRIVISGDWEGS